MSGSIRCFVAIRLDPALRPAAARIQAELGRTRVAVKWVEPENLHLTLKFLGEVPARQTDRIVAVLEQACRGQAPFELELAGLGAFPGARAPRVVWIGVRDGLAALAALAGRVEDALVALGFEREARPFSAHLTLGRIREPERARPLGRALEAGGPAVLGRMAADAVWLMRSDLRPAGPVYTSLARLALAAGT